MSGILQTLIGSLNAVVTDAYFNLVTLLLNTTSTNGAQNNTFLDSSSNAFTITRNGNTTQGTFTPFSQTGWGNYFNGSTDYISLATNTATVLGSSNFTAEAWIYPTSAVSSTQMVIGSWDGTSTLSWVFGVGATAKVYFSWTSTGIYVAGNDIASANNVINPNAWNHIAAVRNGSTITLYVNGVSVASSSGVASSSFYSAANNTKISGNTNSQYYAGYVSNARLVVGAAVYTSNFTVPTSPLGATSGGQNPPTGTQTALLTCQSSRFVDNSTNTIALTANGTPSVQAFSPFAPTAAYSTSVVGGSGYFDGTGDTLATPSITVGANTFCFECWLYPTVTQGANTGIFVGGTTNSLQCSYYDGGSPGGLGIAQKGTGWQIFNNDGVKPIVNQWNHVAFVRSGTGTNQTSIFLNGKRIANGTNSYSYVASTYELSTTNAAGTVFQGYISGARLSISSTPYDATLTTLTIPTAPPSPTGSTLCLNFTNAGIYDAAAKNDMETVGNAQVSTTQSKFGGSSMYFDGTGDWLATRMTENLVLRGDFTIEAWVYPTTISGSSRTIIFLENGTNSSTFFLSSSGILSLDINGVATYTLGSTAVTTNSWQYIAFVRSGSTLTGYINGTSSGTATVTASLGSTGACLIGANSNSGGAPFFGYIDDLRVTKGYARTITTPTAAFPVQ